LTFKTTRHVLPGRFASAVLQRIPASILIKPGAGSIIKFEVIKEVGMNVSEAIRMKRAVREFKDKKLQNAQIEAILNAGRRAQSAKNQQPWQFIAIDDRQTLEELSKLGTYAGHLAGAALGVAILTPDPAQRWSIMFDAGQAAAYMQLVAWEMGIGSCPATIYQPEAARELLGFPDNWHIRVALSFGYPADDQTLTGEPVSGGRNKLEEITHWNSWAD
jgi:nitroreductase